MTEPTSTNDEWRFDDLRALYINCTLKRSPEPSHTQGLIDKSRSIMEQHGVAVDELRGVDHDIATGTWTDMTEHGWPSDEWPALYQRVLDADILVLCGPIWLGDNSSVTKRVVERLYACSSLLNDAGHAPGGAAQAGRRHPGPRQPALGVGGRLPLRQRQPPSTADLREVSLGPLGPISFKFGLDARPEGRTKELVVQPATRPRQG